MTLDTIVEYEGSFLKEHSVPYLLALGVMIVAGIIATTMIYYLAKLFIEEKQAFDGEGKGYYIAHQVYVSFLIVGFLGVIGLGVHSLISVPKNSVEDSYLAIVRDSVDFSAEEGEVIVLASKDDPDVPIGFKYLGDYFEISGETIKEITHDELDPK